MKLEMSKTKTLVWKSREAIGSAVVQNPSKKKQRVKKKEAALITHSFHRREHQNAQKG